MTRKKDLVLDTDALASGDDSRIAKEKRRIVRMGQGAIPLLAQYTTFPVAIVRCHVAYILGKIGGESTSTYLLALADDVVPEVQYDALAAMGDARASSTLPRLFAAVEMDDETHGLSSAAAYSLTKFGTEALPTALELVRSPIASIRSRLALILGKIGGDQAEIALRELLLDSEAQVRCDALEGLVELSPTDLCDLLTTYVEGSDERLADLAGAWRVILKCPPVSRQSS